MPQFKKVYLGNVPKKHANTRMGKHFFLKMGQSRPLFVDFRPFLITISIIQIEKNVDGVLGIRTRSRRRNHGAMAATPG